MTSTSGQDRTQEPAPRDVDAAITSEDIERARRQIGIPQVAHSAPFHPVAYPDGMSAFAFGRVGDDNPLWHDPAYASQTRWRDLIAHPLFLATMGINETPPYDPEHKSLFRGLFRGVGKYHAGQKIEFYRPIYSGTRLYKEYTTETVEVKEISRFSGGRSVIESFRSLYVDASGAPYAVTRDTYVNAERSGSKRTGQYANLQRQSYTKADLERIEEQYAAEERRGPSPRYWEDVSTGDVLIPVVKGPLTMVDIIGNHVATGIALMFHHGPLRYAHKTRRKMPAYYTIDEYGIPQVQQRVHWDSDRAKDLGLPASYDYGAMRTAWLAHLITNWMGDDAWLWKLETQVRRFNFMNDTHVCTGEVASLSREGDHCVANLDLRGANQRGEVTITGKATVLLPSRDNGPVVLPSPPPGLARRGAEMMTRAWRRS